MLHTPVYDVSTRAFCGPTAMSAVTGLPISVIRDAIRKVSGREVTSNGRKHPIMGLCHKDLVVAMDSLGWNVEHCVETDNHLVHHMDKYRLDDFFNDHGHDGPYIVNVTGHYIAVSHGEVCDTYTVLPIEINKWKRGRGRWVKRFFKFVPAM